MPSSGHDTATAIMISPKLWLLAVGPSQDWTHQLTITGLGGDLGILPFSGELLDTYGF